jgi:hypothetical protein
MANLTMLIKLQDGTILGGKEHEEQEEMKLNDDRNRYFNR